MLCIPEALASSEAKDESSVQLSHVEACAFLLAILVCLAALVELVLLDLVRVNETYE